MVTNLERYKKDLEKLVTEGTRLLYGLYAEHVPEEFEDAMKRAGQDPKAIKKGLPNFTRGYQAWYSEAKSLEHFS